MMGIESDKTLIAAQGTTAYQIKQMHNELNLKAPLPKKLIDINSIKKRQKQALLMSDHEDFLSKIKQQ